MTEHDLMRVLEVLILPPALIIWVGLLIKMLVTIRPRIFSQLFTFALLVTWLLSIPAVSQRLMDAFQNDYPALETMPPDADIIVALGGGTLIGGREYGLGGQPGPAMVERLVYAAYLARQYDLPVLVSEARTRNERRSKTHTGERFLKKVLGVKQVIVEGRATSTFENAKFSSKILKNYKKPVLVTSYSHMARAMESFMYFGVYPVPAPTGWDGEFSSVPAYWHWIPQPRALAQSYTALHELFGYYWYRWKLFSNGAPTAQH